MQAIKKPSLLVLLLYPFLYFLAVRLSFSFSTTPEGAVIIWIPNAILLALLLYYQGQRYWAFAVLTMLAEISGDITLFSLKQSVILGLCNISEVTIAYLLMRHLRIASEMSRLQDLSKFLLAGPMFSSLLGGFIGALTLQYLVSNHESYLSMVRIWWFGDGLGLMLFTPLILLALHHSYKRLNIQLRPADWMIAVISIATGGLILCLHHGLTDHFAITPLLLLPCMLYFATRTNLFWTSLLVASISLIIAYLVGHGTLLFGEVDIYIEIIRTQEFIFILTTMCMGLAALLQKIRMHEYELEQRVAERTQALENANQRLANLARTDDLTGLNNRRAFFELAEQEMARCMRYERPLTLIMLDVDHFKAINDTHGHAVGDAVLIHIAEVLRESARISDIFARYGGEEFVILAPETDREAAHNLAERIRSRLEQQPTIVNGQDYPVTVSLGLAFLSNHPNLEKLLLEADRALYRAKANGRNRIEQSVQE